jgi:ankyrin repeat protein
MLLENLEEEPFNDKYGGFVHLARKESQGSESQECYKKQNQKILKSIRMKWGPMFNKRHDLMYQIEDPHISLPAFQMAMNYYSKITDIPKRFPTESNSNPSSIQLNYLCKLMLTFC